MKKIILFGAGKRGAHAIDFFGNELVECFADSSNEKIGNVYCGKKVISIEELKSIWQDYKIIVTPYPSESIIDQLCDMGIKECWKYKQEEVQRAKTYIMGVDWEKYNKVAWYISDEYGRALYNMLSQDNKKKVEAVERECLEVCRQDVDAIIITSPVFYKADEYLLKRFCDDGKILNPYKMVNLYPKDKLVYNKYEIKGIEVDSEDEINLRNKNDIEKKEQIRRCVEELQACVPLFKAVEIETINRCNGTCQFCPVNAIADPREKKIMSVELFHSIIKQLENIKYSGRISLYSNNEPFLDSRITDFCKYTREHLPSARIFLYTNGTLLNMDKFLNTIQYLDELIIDNYTQDLHMIKPVEDIKDYCELHTDLIEKVSIVLRKPEEILSSRGGTSPNRYVQASYPETCCTLPFQQLVIRPTGEVSLCCNDALGKHTLGDLTKESILDVWYGNKYKKVREAIAGGRKNIDICKNCDMFSIY